MMQIERNSALRTKLEAKLEGKLGARPKWELSQHESSRRYRSQTVLKPIRGKF
jgi:hypothetical protein